MMYKIHSNEPHDFLKVENYSNVSTPTWCLIIEAVKNFIYENESELHLWGYFLMFYLYAKVIFCILDFSMNECLYRCALIDSSAFIGQLLPNDDYDADILLTVVIFFCEMALTIGGVANRKESFQYAKELSGVLKF